MSTKQNKVQEEQQVRKPDVVQQAVGSAYEFVATGGVQKTVTTGTHLLGYGVGALAGTIVSPVRSAVTGIAKGFMDNA